MHSGNSLHRLVATFLLVSAALCVPVGSAQPAASGTPARSFSALVFSKTSGFRHASIADGVRALTDLAATHAFTATFTEDAAVFTDAELAGYDVVVFLNTTGDVLGSAQQAAFERFVQVGGGYVGVHAAADTEYGWAWYGGLVGAYFASHPPGTPTAEVRVLDATHPSTEHLPRRWTRTDEWYNFRTNPRGRVHVLMTVGEDTYSGGTMGADHPIAWCHAYDGGRAWYTGGGHTGASYDEPAFRAHLLSGLQWAAGAVAGDCGGTVWDNYQVTPLDTGVQNPMALDVAGDGRVFFVERGGRVKVYTPSLGRSETLLTLAVAPSFEDGLLGIALDPAFDTNGWIYLFYSPAGAPPQQRVSRFTLTGNRLDPTSERVLLEIPTQRDECCHSGGDLAFGPDGSLYIATGDNTNPFADGYAPIDERAGRQAWDAQRTSANTDDLRGKILRIVPQPDGSYVIPEGNLFPGGTEGREEIYAMGLRNPFRITVDAETGWLYWGDVGPDASAPSATRGPIGLDEWNQARTAGNYGWPYCIGPNRPYRDYNYATQTPGAFFDCAAPANTSPNNTGAALLPAAQPAWIYYPYGASPEFPGVTAGGGRTAIAGPVYQHQPEQPTLRQLPAGFDGTFFIAEWSRNWLHAVTLDSQGQPLAISPFLSDEVFRRPIAFKQGPDGALYVIEWGTGFGGDNPDARLTRITYEVGNRAPTARLDARPTSGPAPLAVAFSARGSFDPDPDDRLAFAWDFETDGVVDAATEEAQFTYTEEGIYVATLVVADRDGNEARQAITIIVGNTPPELSIEQPVEGGFFDWGDVLPFTVSARDAEDGSTDDGTIACDALTVQSYIGHDTHSHPLGVQAGCTGTIQVPDGHGDDGEELFYLVEATYTDAGTEANAGLTGRALHRLQPRSKEAEHTTLNSGTETEPSSDPLGGDRQLAFIDNGDYVAYAPVNLSGITHVTYRVASAGTGGRIEVRADAADGPLLGTVFVEPTGGWQTFQSVTAPIHDPGRTHALYLVFLNRPGDTGLFNLNKMRFHGPGVAAPLAEEIGWQAAYFATPDFAGPVVPQTEPMLNYNWARTAPAEGIPPRRFSAIWQAVLTAPVSGTYLLDARVDGGVEVWAGDTLLFAQAESFVAAQTAAYPLELMAGEGVALRVRYTSTSGDAQLTLNMSGPSLVRQPIPPTWLRPLGITVSTQEMDTLPTASALDAPFPSPATGVVTIPYRLASDAAVRLEVLDLLGRVVRTVVDERRGAGGHHATVDLRGLASGLYLCRIQAGTYHATRALLLVR